MPTIIKTASRRNPAAPAPSTSRPENALTGAPIPYTLFQCLLFLASTATLLFAMCATGRAGA